MLEKLLFALEKQGAKVDDDDDTLESFYKWYEERIEEVKDTDSTNLSLDAEVSSSVGLLSFFNLST